MARFLYKSVSATGEVVEGEIEATSREFVVERLRAQGHVPIRAEEAKGSGRSRLSFGGTKSSRGVGLKDVVIMTRELATLLNAGLPLDRAMTIVGELTRAGAMRSLVERVLEKVRGGATFADALSDYEQVFPNYYTGMVRAGEAGGSLETVLNRLADSLERSQALRESVRSALLYPILVVVMAVVSLAILMTWVIPEFRPLFENAGTALPISTQIVIGVSDFMVSYWWALLVALLVVALFIQRHNADPAGRLRWDRWVIGLPVIGSLVIKIEVARFSRTLGSLLANGVSALNALAMTAETAENWALVEALVEAQNHMAKGEGLAHPLAETGLFPHLALQLIQVGEESGRLEDMLLRIADIYDDEVKRTIDRMLAMLVPGITIALGILIALIIGSILAAILSSYDLSL
jgi:general secretion pathway protein F